ncbi:MAG: cell wall-active antibiotics response protein LiaF [Aerococcaceae bacterium]|nr:cell wall-active antibiotics response protein LiaF [Aerococcaceae bacterium]
MKRFIKRNSWLILGIVLLFVVLEVFTSWQNLTFIGAGFVAFVCSFFVTKRGMRHFFSVLSLFFVLVSVLLTRSMLLLVIAIILLAIIFRTNEGNEWIVWGESILKPFAQPTHYHGIQIIQPQSQQRTLLQQQSLYDIMANTSDTYGFDDINLVYFAGSSIIDLGNTLLPEQETVIVIRKMFGRTRLVIPHDVGLSLNMSAISGKMVFEAQTYELLGENFRWKSPNYTQVSRKIRLVISIGFGDVEVILL